MRSWDVSSARGEQRVGKAAWRGETGRRLSQSLAQGWWQCRSAWWQWGWREWVDPKYVLDICPTCWKPACAGGSTPATPRPTMPGPCGGHRETSLPKWPQPVKETLREILSHWTFQTLLKRSHGGARCLGRNLGLQPRSIAWQPQLLIGGVTGWCTGFIFQKVGKWAGKGTDPQDF